MEGRDEVRQRFAGATGSGEGAEAEMSAVRNPAAGAERERGR
jgi:hypothetical protein